MIRQVIPKLPVDYRPQLPAHCYNPATIVVEDAPYNGNLQAAIDAAGPGDIVELLAGKTYVGRITIQATTKGAPGSEIIIRSSGWDNPPTLWNNRVPDTTGMAIIQALGEGNAGRIMDVTSSVNGTGGASYIWFLGLYLMADPVAVTANDLVFVGSSNTVNPADQPHYITFDRCAIRGNDDIETAFGLRLNGAYTAFLNSRIEEVHNSTSAGDGGTGLHLHNYTGPVLIENNFILASGISIMTGGTQNPTGPDMHPRDVTIRHNHCYKNPAWQDRSFTGKPDHWWNCKNLVESKFTHRLLIEDNILEYTWADIPGGQIGHALNMKTSNQTPGTNRYVSTTDVWARYNIIRHCQVPFTMNGSGTSNVAGQPSHRMRYEHNLCYDVSRRWNRPSESGTDKANAANMGANHGARHHQIIHNTFVVDGDDWSPGIAFRQNHAGKEDTPPWWLDELVIRDNLFDAGHGLQGTSQAEGTPTLDQFGRRYECINNVWMGRDGASYGPSSQPDSRMEGNYFPATSNDIGYEDAANDDYRLRADSPYAGAASDGTDVGCDVVQVLERTKNVISGIRG